MSVTGRRAMLLVPAAIAMLSGLAAALMLLGVPAPEGAKHLPEVHGMLLVLGFLGTLIAVERAVACRHWSAYAAPVLLGLGGLLLVASAPVTLSRLALVAGTGGLVALYIPLWQRQRDDAVVVQALGAVLALGAAVLWLGGVTTATLLPWLVGFVVLTIAGERLELARIAMGVDAGATLVTLASGLAAAIVAALLWPTVGAFLFGIALVAITGWLWTHDVARHTVRSSGLPRYIACCLLAGYGWLSVAGGIWLLGGPALDGERYDAVVHAAFLGFAMSMVMAHAPVILPAVLRRPLPYHPALFAPVALLHGSLVLRLWAGDGLGSREAWLAGGVLNVVALVLFVAVAVWAGVRGRAPATAQVRR